jgi:hypothetical protein
LLLLSVKISYDIGKSRRQDMAKQQDKKIVEGLWEELKHEEDAVWKADQALKEAQAKFDVASRKYAAVRDMVIRHLGQSPYSQDDDDGLTIEIVEGAKEGEPAIDFYGMYRFIHMPIGTAIVIALKEAKEPMTLDGIVRILRGGGIRKSEHILTRAVNAALMRTKGIQKTEDGEYYYSAKEVEPEGEPEDLPF